MHVLLFVVAIVRRERELRKIEVGKNRVYLASLNRRLLRKEPQLFNIFLLFLASFVNKSFVLTNPFSTENNIYCILYAKAVSFIKMRR